ncbi:MAG: tRNA (guanosine(46)-N7)-methyltransferase TrmB [Saprospiraceae bacterium]|nr:tRNA (guanosine(46)-N7)-methyltransferase TrmB [Saprospiraceae bacterium]
MGRKNKLRKFSEMLSFDNVVQNFDYLKPMLVRGANEEVDFKGNWSRDFFGNDHGLILELACGRGEYTLALAAHDPGNNYLGVDVKGARIWKGAKKALDAGLVNAGFLRTRIEQLELFFAPAEVDAIWITFPDPFLLKERNRLTHHRFLNKYTEFLKPGGHIHLKTDDEVLYEFSLESFNSWNRGKIEYHHQDIYAGPLENEVLNFKTYYENKHLEEGRKIKYIRYKFDF